MALLDVITYGHPTLRKKAQPYGKNEIDTTFIKDMLETMYVKDGVGLAAPQVNISKQMLVCQDGEKEYILFNPKIIAHSEALYSNYEGCLSLPGLNAKVPRYEKVIVSALNQEGEEIEITAKGMLAVILQHEIDHLNGVLYIDRAELKTLSWTDAEFVAPELRGKMTDIDTLKTIFSEQNKDIKNLQFELIDYQ